MNYTLVWFSSNETKKNSGFCSFDLWSSEKKGIFLEDFFYLAISFGRKFLLITSQVLVIESSFNTFNENDLCSESNETTYQVMVQHLLQIQVIVNWWKDLKVWWQVKVESQSGKSISEGRVNGALSYSRTSFFRIHFSQIHIPEWFFLKKKLRSVKLGLF